MLCWEGSGPLDCNSNDGKRSEWVNIVSQGGRSSAIASGMFGGISHGFHFMEMKNLEDEKVGNIISMDFLRGVG